MAVCNAKIVHASAVALNYGPNFTYRERQVPTGFRFTAQLGLISLLPALLTQLAMLVGFLVLKCPVIGQAIIDRFLPPGTGSSDQMCRAGCAEVYAEVIGPADTKTGRVDKANCSWFKATQEIGSLHSASASPHSRWSSIETNCPLAVKTASAHPSKCLAESY
jgi:hypothetical protein